MRMLSLSLSFLLTGAVSQTDSFSPARMAQESWGAIAYSNSTSRWGSSTNLFTRDDAERRAITECGEQDCRVVIAFRNSCGAFARDGSNVWGVGTGSSEDEANRSAIFNCQRNGGRDCRI